MNTVSDLGLDLDKLFQPAWAQGKTEANRFDKFTGNEGMKPERSSAANPANAAARAAKAVVVVLAAVANAVALAARRAAAPSLATARAASVAAMIVVANAVSGPNRRRRCRKSASLFCRMKTASSRCPARSR